MIVGDVIAVLKEKRFPIILTERKEHLEILKEKLHDRAIPLFSKE